MGSYYNPMEGGGATRDELDGFGELRACHYVMRRTADVVQICVNLCQRTWARSTLDQTEGISSSRLIKSGHDRQTLIQYITHTDTTDIGIALRERLYHHYMDHFTRYHRDFLTSSSVSSGSLLELVPARRKIRPWGTRQC